MDKRRISPSDALPVDKAVIVIGAGTMGSGIAEVAALAGHRVFLRYASQTARERGLGQIRRSLDKRVVRGRLEVAQRDDAVHAATPAGPRRHPRVATLVGALAT